jgi:hypothetical protein
MADGVAPTSDVLTSRRPQVDIEYDPREAQLRGQQLAGKHAPNLPWLQATFSGQTGPDCPEDVSRNRARWMRQTTRRFSPPNMLCPTT